MELVYKQQKTAKMSMMGLDLSVIMPMTDIMESSILKK